MRVGCGRIRPGGEQTSTITAPNTSIEEAEKEADQAKAAETGDQKQRAAYRKKLAEYNRKKSGTATSRSPPEK